MRLLSLFTLVFLLTQATAQFRVKRAVIKYELPNTADTKPVTSNAFGLLPDEQNVFKYQSPSLTNLPGTTFNHSQSFWINNVTSQSYNNGRFGTFYYWDVQGNLQGTRGFIDLSGKNKRGIKLLFPWR